MKKYLIRLIGTDDYYGKYAPVGTTKQDATRLTEEEANDFIEKSKKKKGNKGKSKLEIVEVDEV